MRDVCPDRAMDDVRMCDFAFGDPGLARKLLHHTNGQSDSSSDCGVKKFAKGKKRWGGKRKGLGKLLLVAIARHGRIR